MEKIVALFFGLFILLMVGLPLWLFYKLITRSKNVGWQGEVMKKEHNTAPNYDDETRDDHFYYLVVKMDETGEERKIGLSEKLWNQFEIGDKIQKPKGKLFPNKI